MKEKLNPSANLINFETNTESESNTISDEIFYPVLKYLKEKIAECKAIPTRNFINESYFLYDKSNLIKKTHSYLQLKNNYHFMGLLATFLEIHQLKS